MIRTKTLPSVPRIEPAPGGTGCLVRYPDGRLDVDGGELRLRVETETREGGLQIRVTPQKKGPRR